MGGSYSGANPMGLFQFMAPDDPRPLGFGALSGTSVVRLEAKVDGRTVATATATRRSPEAVGVTTRKLTVPADGVYGVLYRPKDTTTRMPALLVFGGSEGGLSYPVQVKAALLAAHGYPTLALAYFDAPGLPKDLAAIPLEYFRKARSRSSGPSPASTPIICWSPAHPGAARAACWWQRRTRTWSTV